MAPEARCVYCRRRAADPSWLPFCSERCRLADLGRWLSGDYTVPGTALSQDEDDGNSAEGRPPDTKRDK